MEISITHDEKIRRFSCSIEGHECVVDYDRREDIIDIHRTFVHADLRGKGIAEMLLKAISNYAMGKELSVVPTCSYAVLFYKRNKEYASILSKDADLTNGGSCRLPNKQ